MRLVPLYNLLPRSIMSSMEARMKALEKEARHIKKGQAAQAELTCNIDLTSSRVKCAGEGIAFGRGKVREHVKAGNERARGRHRAPQTLHVLNGSRLPRSQQWSGKQWGVTQSGGT